MPIEPDILFGIRPVAIPTPQQFEGQQLELQANRMAVSEKARTLQTQARVRSLVQQYGGVEPALPAIMAVDPVVGMGLQNSLAQSKVHQLDYQRLELQHQQEKLDLAASHLTGIDSQEKLDAVHLFFERMGWPDQGLTSVWNSETTPQEIDAIKQRSLTVAQQNAAAEKKLADARAEAVAAETARKNAAVETERARHQQETEALARTDKLSDNERADRAAKEAERHNQATERAALIRANRPAAGVGAAADALSDVKETVQGMKDGTIPPQLPGRASKEYVALMAEAHRQGFDLSRAATDWVATQKHIATLNGSQQTRLMQNINAMPEMLDRVDALAAQWKGGRFPLLNRVNLAAATNGVYGPEAATVANQLAAQIADVTSDLGAIYMGGNSPTDEALRLAKTALSGDWDARVLKDMTKLARENVQTRKNSINSSGVAGASADNPYVPKVAAPAAPAAPGAAAAPAIGSTVTYQGKRYKVIGIENGQAQLQAVP